MKVWGKWMVLSVLLIGSLLLFAACGAKEDSNGGSGEETAAFIVLEETLDKEEYGVGFRNEDVALGLAVQEAMDGMLEDGTAAEISKKWFGEDIMIRDADFYEESEVPAGDTSLEDIKAKGTFVLGLDENFPPMGFRDESGTIVGFDIDLATEVAKRLEVELVLQPIDWDAKEMELSTGKIDCIWNGMTVNPERLEAMFFTKPYIANEQIVIVPGTSEIATFADLEGKTVCLQKGSSSLDALNKNEALAASLSQIVEFTDNVTAFLDLKAGRIDAFAVDEVAGRYIMVNN